MEIENSYDNGYEPYVLKYYDPDFPSKDEYFKNIDLIVNIDGWEYPENMKKFPKICKLMMDNLNEIEKQAYNFLYGKYIEKNKEILELEKKSKVNFGILKAVLTKLKFAKEYNNAIEKLHQKEMENKKKESKIRSEKSKEKEEKKIKSYLKYKKYESKSKPKNEEKIKKKESKKDNLFGQKLPKKEKKKEKETKTMSKNHYFIKKMFVLDNCKKNISKKEILKKIKANSKDKKVIIIENKKKTKNKNHEDIKQKDSQNKVKKNKDKKKSNTRLFNVLISETKKKENEHNQNASLEIQISEDCDNSSEKSEDEKTCFMPTIPEMEKLKQSFIAKNFSVSVPDYGSKSNFLQKKTKRSVEQNKGSKKSYKN